MLYHEGVAPDTKLSDASEVIAGGDPQLRRRLKGMAELKRIPGNGAAARLSGQGQRLRDCAVVQVRRFASADHRAALVCVKDSRHGEHVGRSRSSTRKTRFSRE